MATTYLLSLGQKKTPSGNFAKPPGFSGVSAGGGWHRVARAPSTQFEKVRNRFCSVGNVLRRLTDSTPVMLSLESRENSKQTKL